MKKLRRERDELRVQMHLARAELRDEWHVLVQKWSQFEARTKTAGAGDRTTAKHTFETPLGALADELGNAFRKIRGRLH